MSIKRNTQVMKILAAWGKLDQAITNNEVNPADPYKYFADELRKQFPDWHFAFYEDKVKWDIDNLIINIVNPHYESHFFLIQAGESYTCYPLRIGADWGDPRDFKI